MPQMMILAGVNGTGKTTLASAALSLMGIDRFINADHIARGLNPVATGSVERHAARLMLSEIQDCLQNGEDFAFETTLSGRGYLQKLSQARSIGYKINMLYLWLPDVDACYQRIQKRVSQGGHDIPLETVRRRFNKSLNYLMQDYLPLVDHCEILTYNDDETPRLIAVYQQHQWCIKDPRLWTIFQTMNGKVGLKRS